MSFFAGCIVCKKEFIKNVGTTQKICSAECRKIKSSKRYSKYGNLPEFIAKRKDAYQIKKASLETVELLEKRVKRSRKAVSKYQKLMNHHDEIIIKSNNRINELSTQNEVLK